MALEVRIMVATPKTVRQSPLKVDPETDQLISQGAHFLGLTKKDLVAEAVRVYLEQRHEDLRAGMVEALQVLDGSLKSDVMLLTGLTSADAGDRRTTGSEDRGAGRLVALAWTRRHCRQAVTH